MIQRYYERLRFILLCGLLLACAIQLVGCTGQPPLPEPQTWQERVVRESIRAQKIADAAELASTELLDRRLIHSSTSIQVADAAVKVRSAVTDTRRILALNWDNQVGAVAALRAADSALELLRTFLAANNLEIPQ